MREILFRGMLPKCKEWVYGGYFKAEYCDGKGLQNFIKINGAGFVPVLPETVGQYTGLTDKNGVKIFEGDIVDHYAFSGSVVFENGMFSSNSSANINFCECKQPLAYHDTKEMEVIGNIHDGEVQ